MKPSSEIEWVLKTTFMGATIGSSEYPERMRLVDTPAVAHVSFRVLRD